MSISKSQSNIAAMLAKAGRKVTVIDAINESKPPIVREFNHAPTMSMEDELTRLRAENTALRNYLERAGWGPCNIAACNCNGWHKVRASRDEIELGATNKTLKEQMSELGKAYCKQVAESASLRVQRDSRDLRAIVGELRRIETVMSFDTSNAARQLRDLLRRLDETQ